MNNKNFQPGNYVKFITGDDVKKDFVIARILERKGDLTYKVRTFEKRESQVDWVYPEKLRSIDIIDIEPWTLNWDLIDKGEGYFLVSYINNNDKRVKSALIINKQEKKVYLDFGFKKVVIDTMDSLQNFLKEYHDFDLHYTGDEGYDEHIE